MATRRHDDVDRLIAAPREPAPGARYVPDWERSLQLQTHLNKSRPPENKDSREITELSRSGSEGPMTPPQRRQQSRSHPKFWLPFWRQIPADPDHSGLGVPHQTLGFSGCSAPNWPMLDPRVGLAMWGSATGTSRSPHGPDRLPACAHSLRGTCRRDGRWSSRCFTASAPPVPDPHLSVTTRGCDVAGCDRPHDARGLCAMHYKRLMRGGTLHRLNQRQQGLCSVDGCDQPKAAKGLCRGHYQRLRATGDVGSSTIPTRTPRGVHAGCAVSGCDRPHAGKGYCSGHLRRLRTRGEPGAPFGPPATTPCSVQGCDRMAHARGQCRQHYDQRRR